MSWVLTFILFALLVSAVVCDVHSRRIPNALTLGGALLGVVARAIEGGSGALLDSIEGLLIAAAVGFGFWAAHLIGGADHKLLIAAGALVGYPQIIPTMAAVALVGGLQALIWVGAAKLRSPALSMRALFKSVRLPYSVAIALGTLMVFALRAYGIVP